MKILTCLAVLGLLGTAFLLGFLSLRDTALTFDELAHIPAGYSYLTQQDYRVNPEHPPLLKDLAALPLLFLDLNFPDEGQNWQQKEAPAWWVQFDLGTEFLYGSGNNPREIISWSRIPMLGLFLLLLLLVFLTARQLAGTKAGLLALFFAALSPTLLAHGRLVTTDVAAALGALIALVTWVKFLQGPSWRNMAVAGLAFGIAMSLKFTLVLLIPFFAFLLLFYSLLYEKRRLKAFFVYAAKGAAVGLIGVVFVLWPLYQFHVAKYPAERQKRDTAAVLMEGRFTAPEKLTVWASDKPILRPLAQYARGVLMAGQRSTAGNTTYFAGKLTAQGTWQYFPVLYATKVPLAFHILALLALLGALWMFLPRMSINSRSEIYRHRHKITIRSWLKERFVLFAMILWVLLYFGFAIQGNLNIGVRHLLPIFPFLYILVALGLVKAYERIPLPFNKRIALLSLTALLFWYALPALSTTPHFLSYYNVLGGGTENGYKIAVDSNYDWGQDFYRLLRFVEENDIQKIHLAYFGGENPEYWLGDKYVKLNPQEPPQEGWVAISVNELMGGLAEPAPDYTGPTHYYDWLKYKTPTARAGTSIFLYNLNGN
ncbi:MAG: glycosyltransferase family 39 protein [Patescibacteria group bacterium]